VTASQDAALDQPDATSVSPQHHSLTVQVLRRLVESTLAARVAVVDQPATAQLAAPDGHLQRVQGQVGAQVGGELPTHQQAAEHIQDEGDVDPAFPGAHVGQVGDP
jgi:hypothetical protein